MIRFIVILLVTSLIVCFFALLALNALELFDAMPLFLCFLIGMPLGVISIFIGSIVAMKDEEKRRWKRYE